MSSKNAIVNFLKKLKTMDSVPESVVDAACELADEACEEEIEEVKDEGTVQGMEETKSLEEIVRDAVNSALASNGIIKDESMNSLDEVLKSEEEQEENLVEAEDAEGEESVTVDPEKISLDSAKKIIREIKPYIAGISDKDTRKKISDSIAALAKVNRMTTTDYASIYKAVTSNKASKAKDNEYKMAYTDDYSVGNNIANKYNPHYNKEGK